MAKQEETSQSGNLAETTESSSYQYSEIKLNNLQTQYIALLEQRIKVLEHQLETKKSDEGLKDETESEVKEDIGEKQEESNESRIEYRESKWGTDGERRETVIGQSLNNKDSREEVSLQVPVAFIKYYDNSGQYQNNAIRSKECNLNALILFILAHNPIYKHFRDTGPCHFSSPYEPFIHSWSDLQDVAQQKEGSDRFVELQRQIFSEEHATTQYSTLKDLKDPKNLTLTLDYLKQVLQYIEQTSELEDYFKNRREPSSDAVTSVAWDDLWTVFPPGELILTRQCMKQPQLLIVQEASASNNEQRERDNKEVWLLYAWTYDWDGKQYSRAMVTVKFERFKAKNRIDSLDCYPLKYDPAPLEVMKILIERGRKFSDYLERPSRVFEYSGAAHVRGGGFSFQKQRTSHLFSKKLEETNEETETRPRSRHLSKDQVIVDHKAYTDHGPESETDWLPMDQLEVYDPPESDRCQCQACEDNKRLNDNQKHAFDRKKSSKDFDDLQFSLLPPRMLGYWLAQKTWLEMEVGKVKPIDSIDTEALEKLQLAKKKKELIKSLIESHTISEKPSMTDFSTEKGRGLVILLHGPPGVGKTSTAECVARTTGTPLLPVTPSDIGIDTGEIEKKLNHLFELASSWNAILLFDEADVLLESRSNNTADIRRNSLVSVLLRSLEYYSGILILTTNRIRSVDIAVQSRINLAIRYPDLSYKSKHTIFHGFINQLSDEGANKEELGKWIKEEPDTSPFEKLNGRQIRNVLFSAVSLASRENRPLRVSDVERMLNETRDFVNDLASVINDARGRGEVGFSAT